MSEQQAEQSGVETGSLGAGPAVPNSSDVLIESVTESGQDAGSVESPNIAPGAEAAKGEEADAPKAGMAKDEMKDEVKAEMPKAEPFKVESLPADAPKSDISKPESPNSEVIKTEAVKSEESQPEVAKPEAARDEASKSVASKMTPAKIEPAKLDPVKAWPARPRELLVMSPRDSSSSWKRTQSGSEKGGFEKGSYERDRFGKSGFEKTGFESRSAESKAEKEAPPAANDGRRRFAAMAAMLALAVIAGAAGGAFATVGMSHFTETASVSAPDTGALEASVARIDADIVALKAGLEQTTKAGLAQFNKTSDRLERIEKAQNEPNAKLAKLNEAVDKLRAAAPAQAASTTVAAAAPRDVTGTVAAPAGAQPLPMPQASPAAAGTTPRTEVGRLPTVDNWVLRDVSHGSALIEGRTGLYEVFAGDPVPGLGRVEAIRKQDGRWVVVTPKGLIVAR